MNVRGFFYKQKTAYERRISDWSSDVCSSDLRRTGLQRSASDQDARVQRAFKMGVRARAIAGDPAARPVGERDAPVERGRELQGHEWPAARRTRPPRSETRRVGQHYVSTGSC